MQARRVGGVGKGAKRDSPVAKPQINLSFNIFVFAIGDFEDTNRCREVSWLNSVVFYTREYGCPRAILGATLVVTSAK